jgi:Bacterial archaeo-eukaryotic release factor family 10
MYVRTDPRDPANTAHVPAWVVALRNGLRDVGRQVEVASREQRLAVRALSRRVEAELLELVPAERGRGVAWFLTPDGALDRRISLQLAPRWDERPFVSPLVDVADRGRAAGLVLVAGERVRLLHWEGGRVREPERSLYELELGDWREYAAYAMANPARAQQTATHEASYEQRVEDWRGRFLRDAAQAVASRLSELGWRRLVVAAEGQVASRFVDALPEQARRLVVARVEANLLGEEPAAVADRLEEELEDAWRRELLARAARAVEAARPDGPGVAGFGPVVEALVQYRVEWLLLDPHCPFDGAGLGPAAAEALGDAAPDLLAERAVELAAAGGAGVSALPVTDSAPLAEAGGIAATLRY